MFALGFVKIATARWIKEIKSYSRNSKAMPFKLKLLAQNARRGGSGLVRPASAESMTPQSPKLKQKLEKIRRNLEMKDYYDDIAAEVRAAKKEFGHNWRES